MKARAVVEAELPSRPVVSTLPTLRALSRPPRVGREDGRARHTGSGYGARSCGVRHDTPGAVTRVLAHVMRVRLLQLQIFQAVVRPVAVDVVDDILRSKGATEVEFHDHPMLPDTPIRRKAFWKRIPGRREHHHVSGRRERTATLPPWGTLAGDSFAASHDLCIGKRRGANAVGAVSLCDKGVSAPRRARRPAAGGGGGANGAKMGLRGHASMIT